MKLNNRGFANIDLVIATVFIAVIFIAGVFGWLEIKNNGISLNKVYRVSTTQGEREGVADNLKNPLEFNISKLDIDKFDEYLKNNKTSQYKFQIKGINKIIYRDLDGDQRNEAFIEFNTDGYDTNNIFERLLGYIIKPTQAGGWGVQSVFGVFVYNDKSDLWEPIYADVVYYPITGMGGNSNADVASLIRVDITSRDFGEAYRYGKNPTNEIVPTEIIIEKAFCLDDTCSYKLVFKNLDFTKESLK